MQIALFLLSTQKRRENEGSINVCGHTMDIVFRAASLQVWSFFFSIAQMYFLNAPLYLGGEEGKPLHDICARLMNIDSSNFFTDAGKQMCDERIEKSVSGKTSIVITVFLCVFVQHLYYVVLPKAYVEIKKLVTRKPSAVDKAALTRKFNKEMEKMLGHKYVW